MLYVNSSGGNSIQRERCHLLYALSHHIRVDWPQKPHGRLQKNLFCFHNAHLVDKVFLHYSANCTQDVRPNVRVMVLLFDWHAARKTGDAGVELWL